MQMMIYLLQIIDKRLQMIMRMFQFPMTEMQSAYNHTNSMDSLPHTLDIESSLYSTISASVEQVEATSTIPTSV